MLPICSVRDVRVVLFAWEKTSGVPYVTGCHGPSSGVLWSGVPGQVETCWKLVPLLPSSIMRFTRVLNLLIPYQYFCLVACGRDEKLTNVSTFINKITTNITISATEKVISDHALLQ